MNQDLPKRRHVAIAKIEVKVRIRNIELKNVEMKQWKDLIHTFYTIGYLYSKMVIPENVFIILLACIIKSAYRPQ